MSWLDGELTTMALCWRLERRDGVGIGLTAHDRDLMIDGNVYRSNPGMTPSAIKRGDGGDASSMDVAGAMTSAAIIANSEIGTRISIFGVLSGVCEPEPPASMTKRPEPCPIDADGGMKPWSCFKTVAARLAGAAGRRHPGFRR